VLFSKSLFDCFVSGLLKHSLEKQDLDIHCLMLLGAYQILYSNIAQHASIYETVNIAESGVKHQKSIKKKSNHQPVKTNTLEVRFAWENTELAAGKLYHLQL
jgi:hypothetical protein